MTVRALFSLSLSPLRKAVLRWIVRLQLENERYNEKFFHSRISNDMEGLRDSHYRQILLTTQLRDLEVR